MEEKIEGPLDRDELVEALIRRVRQLERSNRELKEERERDLVLLRNKELKIGELKAEIETREVVIFRLRKSHRSSVRTGSN